MFTKCFDLLEIPEKLSYKQLRNYQKKFLKKSLDDVGLYNVLNELVYEYFDFPLCECCGISSAEFYDGCDECDKCVDDCCVVTGKELLCHRDFETYFFNSGLNI